MERKTIIVAIIAILVVTSSVIIVVSALGPSNIGDHIIPAAAFTNATIESDKTINFTLGAISPATKLTEISIVFGVNETLSGIKTFEVSNNFSIDPITFTLNRTVYIISVHEGNWAGPQDHRTISGEYFIVRCDQGLPIDSKISLFLLYRLDGNQIAYSSIHT